MKSLAIVLLTICVTMGCSSRSRVAQPGELTQATHEYNEVLAETLRSFDQLTTDDQRVEFVKTSKPRLEKAVSRWRSCYESEEVNHTLASTVRTEEYSKEYSRMKELAPKVFRTLKPYDR